MSKQITGYDFTLSQKKSDGSLYDKDEVAQILMPVASKFVFQLEKGDKTGYLHFQGRLRLHKKMTHKALLKSFEGKSLADLPSFQPTTGEQFKKSSFSYVMKEQTRVEGPWKETDFADKQLEEPAYIPKQYRIEYKDLYPYQKFIYDNAKTYDPRHVNILVDLDGSRGKSTIANIVCIKFNGLIAPNVRDSEKIIYSVCDTISALRIRETVPVFIDMPRSLCKDDLSDFYTAIETIKGGALYDIRNKHKRWYVDSPNIWVFCNEAPKLHYLTRNRWIFWRITDDNQLVQYDPKDDIEDSEEDFREESDSDQDDCLIRDVSFADSFFSKN